MTSDRRDIHDPSLEETVAESITHWIDVLKRGDDESIDPSWDRYFDRLVRLASRRLGSVSAPRDDEPVPDEADEELTISLVDSLCGGAAAGRFDHLQGRDELWKLLTAITATKTMDQLRQRSTIDHGRTEDPEESEPADPPRRDQAAPEPSADFKPTNEFLAVMNQQCRRLFEALPDPSQHKVARLKLEGFTNQQIADRLQISLRSVERKLNLIREIWCE